MSSTVANDSPIFDSRHTEPRSTSTVRRMMLLFSGPWPAFETRRHSHSKGKTVVAVVALVVVAAAAAVVVVVQVTTAAVAITTLTC